MTEFLLTRHGVTDWNLERRIQGHSDIPLNGAGLAQAETLAKTLIGQRFDLIISSDLKRAAQTAHILASFLAASIQYDQRLREVNHGRWEGMLINELHEQFGIEYAAFRNDPISSRAPGGESLAEAILRISEVIEETAARFPSGRILVVSHGLILALFRCKIYNQPFNQAHQFGLDNCAGDMINWPVASQT